MSTHKLDVKKLRESDQEALEEIARYLLPDIERMITRFYPWADVSDIVQDVFVDILRNRERLSSFETSEQVSAYCLRLARNAAVHRSPRVHQEIERSEYHQQELEKPEEFAIETHEVDILKRTQVEEAVSQLSEEEQKLVLAYFYDGQTTAEIAKSFGLTAASVRLRLKRTLDRIRRQLLLAGYKGDEQ